MSAEPPKPPEDNSNNENFPEMPDDISGLVDDIQDREAQRRKALEIALERAKAAASGEERDYWLVKAMEFGDILDEYKGLYPELFPDDGTEKSN